MDAPTYEEILKGEHFIKNVLDGVASRDLDLDTDKFNLLCSRICNLDHGGFDKFMSTFFEYLLQWQEKDIRSFEVLAVMIEILDMVVRIVTPSLKLEIINALRSIDLWHVKMLVCWDLFGQPKESLDGLSFEKTEFSIPFEIFRDWSKNSSPSADLAKRILFVKDNFTYKFCVLALEQLFTQTELQNMEKDMDELRNHFKTIVLKHGQKCVPRLKNVLLQILGRAAV